ncbi:MAG: sugar phosphate isomerase/epimerase [Bacteroidetes bacterium]|nr:sugar phosphate isomerase/epimerase [Bacteroidota bacterium]
MKKIVDSLGVMQGRLLPKYKGRYQAHPVGKWEQEFDIAASFNLKFVEFILDYEDVELNPLMSKSGLDKIIATVERAGVGVKSVCADYFMEAPLHHSNSTIVNSSIELLRLLLNNCKYLGVKDIVIPCVDQSSIRSLEQRDQFVRSINRIIDIAEKVEINLSLETDLPPLQFAELLDRFDSKRVTVNYDTGNSASLGYNPIDEFQSYGSRISDIHIKDRVYNGGSVLMGSGNTDFKAFFEALSTIEYNGIFIMQVFRDEQGVDIFGQQLDYFKNIIPESL